MKPRKFRQLHIIHIAYFLLSLVIGIVIGGLVYLGGLALINTYYLSESAISSRRRAYEDSFEQFVSKNAVASTDYKQISTWIKQNSDVYLFLIDTDGYIIYESGQWSDISSMYIENVPENAETINNADENILYPTRVIEFTDGGFALYIDESSETFYHYLAAYSAIALAILCVMLLQIRFTSKIIKKVKRLSDEVNHIEIGNINYPITKEGSNELSQLAHHVDTMRDSLLSQMKREQNLVHTNYDLISGLSHDVRTPLTSLIGYMEVLDEHPDLSDEQKQEYIKRSKDKTFQLKLITNKMFQHLFDFNESYLETHVHKYELMVLLPQLIYERVFDLQRMDFEVAINLEDVPKQLNVDIQYLHRLFDNVFSNISRYALKKGVSIRGHLRGDDYVLECENFKDFHSMNTKSTNIGLKTCTSIMHQLGGTFAVHQTARKFIVTITIPTEENV